MSGSSSAVGFRGVTLVTQAGGAANWVDLNDTAASITADQFVRGNAGGTALEFADLNGANGYLRRDGSNTITGVITPDADITRDFGSTSLRFNEIIARGGSFVAGDQGFTRGVNAEGSVIAGRSEGTGTNTFNIGGASFPPAALFGNVYSYGATSTATMDIYGGGSFMVGSAFAYYVPSSTAEILGDSAAYGSFTGGYAYPVYGATGTRVTIRNSGRGAFLWAYPSCLGNSQIHEARVQTGGSGSFCGGRTQGLGSAYIWSNGPGAFVWGFVNASNATGKGRLRGQGDGSFAQGSVVGSTAGATSYIDAGGDGSFAQGVVLTGSYINANGPGSFAQGRGAQGGGIYATQRGAFAQGSIAGTGAIQATQQGAMARGRCSGAYYITASAQGSVAMGSTVGASIVASATNAFQFGPGTNAVADSLQINSEIQFFGPTGRMRFTGILECDPTTVTGTTHTAADEHVILVDDDTAGSAVTVTLPLAATADAMYYVKKLGTTANVIVDGNGAETVDGAANATLTLQHEAILVVSNGSAWFVL